MVKFHGIRWWEHKRKADIEGPVFHAMLEVNFKYKDNVGFAIINKSQLPMFESVLQVERMGSLESIRKLAGVAAVPSSASESEGADESL
jgi:hypothetical protein